LTENGAPGAGAPTRDPIMGISVLDRLLPCAPPGRLLQRAVLLPLTLIALSGCALVTPDLTFEDQARQAVAEVSRWDSIPEGQPTAALTDLIGSTRLDGLVAEALDANPGLQQTLLTLRIRQAQARQTGAAQWPTVDAGYSASRSDNDGMVTTSYTGSVTVGWELDLWRKLADTSEAALKDVAEQAALTQAARDTLAAEVMQAWITLIADARAIDIQGRRLSALERTEGFIVQRYRNGLGDLADLDSARQSLATGRAGLEDDRETLNQERRSLREMLGRTGAEPIAIPDDYPEVIVPLADLPAQTLARRPDLKAAYLAIEAAHLRSDVAYKDLLPSISLQTSLEDVAESPADALLTGPVWSLLGQLTAPLFRGGELRAAAEVAELEAAQAFEAYRETLVGAVREVDDALGQETTLARRQAHIEEALAIARRNVTQYRERYRAGLVDILDLLTVQQEAYDLEAQVNDLIQQRLSNRIDLGLALGLGVPE